MTTRKKNKKPTEKAEDTFVADSELATFADDSLDVIEAQAMAIPVVDGASGDDLNAIDDTDDVKIAQWSTADDLQADMASDSDADNSTIDGVIDNAIDHLVEDDDASEISDEELAAQLALQTAAQSSETGNESDEADQVRKEAKYKAGLLQEVLGLRAAVEAIIFASPKPIKPGEILEVLQDEKVATKDISDIIDELMEFYELRSGGFKLEYLRSSGYQFRTVPAAAPIMERMFSKRARPLSRAALETLAIVAYKQPITRAEIEYVRGVDVGSALKNLLERTIIKCVGKKNEAGRPLLFGTTEEFLKIYRLSSLKELPSLDSFQVNPEVMAQAKEKMKNVGEHVAVEEFIGDQTSAADVADELAQIQRLDLLDGNAPTATEVEEEEFKEVDSEIEIESNLPRTILGASAVGSDAEADEENTSISDKITYNDDEPQL